MRNSQGRKIKKNRVIAGLIGKLEPYRPERVYLFGSCARNESDDVSDIDLAIIKTTDEDFFERIRTVMRLLDYKKSLDVLVYTPEEFQAMQASGNSFAQAIVEEGVLLYEQARQPGGSKTLAGPGVIRPQGRRLEP